MGKHTIIITLMFLVPFTGMMAQSDNAIRYSESFNDEIRSNHRFRIAFWNVENLFDLKDDSLTFDEEFTPEGGNHYSFGRYKAKSNGIARTLLALGGWEAPEIIGLCEVESQWVMDGLTKFSPLKNIEYQTIHEDSPDFRGIDIAAMYRPDKFNLIRYEYIRIKFPDNPRTTRDMLYMTGILPNSDTLHVFINHWPSRYGGQFASAPSREFVAQTLRNRVDSIYDQNKDALIVIMGDLNDEPDDISVKDVLGAKISDEDLDRGDLFNLMAKMKYKFGTHSFAGEWGVLDQIIVSASLLNENNTSNVFNRSAYIFDAPWLLKLNAAGKSVTNRTYQGPAYQGGYSDHLPIYMDLLLKNIP